MNTQNEKSPAPELASEAMGSGAHPAHSAIFDAHAVGSNETSSKDLFDGCRSETHAEASPSVIAAAVALIAADRAQALTTAHVDALDNAIKIHRGELRLPGPRAEATDTQRIDWLCEHVVNVRLPLPYGSRDMFWASPIDDDSGHTPSDLRAKIDAASAGGQHANG